MGHSNCDKCGHDTKMCDCPDRIPFVAQVGGTHYQAKYQHWDYASETGLGYLEGCATKYVSRWRKKGGVEDLMKAISYVKKLMVVKPRRPAGERWMQTHPKCTAFIEAAGITGTCEALIINKLDVWKTDQDLITIIRLIEELIRGA